MQPEPENLNTEPNDIAGNPLGGPAGNTATKPTAPGQGVGMPGGVPHSPDSARATAATDETLAAAETGAGPGGVDASMPTPVHRESNPRNLGPDSSVSDNPHESYLPQAHQANQDSTANRGEFGVKSQQGTTHAGFGNQNRQADYEPHHSAEDQYYGGPGAPGPQDNAYRAYDGRDERADPRADYGFERGAAPAPAGGGEPAAPAAAQRGSLGSPAGDNRNQPDRADAASAHQDDNGSRPGPGSGYAADYGHTSLPGAATPGSNPAEPNPEHRNQTEDYLPTPSDTDSQGRAVAPAAATDPRSPQPASSEGYGDRGRQQPNAAPDLQTGDDRNGYTNAPANKGDEAQGVGSRGGSYNDAYDDSKPGSTQGSPAAGEQREEDRAGNYGSAARAENRASEEENRADHGAPQRNEGRA